MACAGAAPPIRMPRAMTAQATMGPTKRRMDVFKAVTS
jgi:hypothetical protein